MRIAYFGLPLGALLLARDGFAPALVVLSPPDAPGRRRLLRTVKAPILDSRSLSPERLESTVDQWMQATPPDLVVSWYFTRRLPARWLSAARHGAIGAHPSLLPRHRGPDPFFWAIDSGDRETGVSVHYLVEEYDAGDVLVREAIPVGERNAWQLARALDRPSLRLLRRTVHDFSTGVPASTPQEGSLATWAPEPTGDELRVDFGWPTERVTRRIRALSPVPGVALEIRGVPLFVAGAEATSEYPRALAPGEAAVTAGGVVIRTGDGAVRLTRAVVDDPQAPDDSDVVTLDRTGIAARVGGAGR